MPYKDPARQAEAVKAWRDARTPVQRAKDNRRTEAARKLRMPPGSQERKAQNQKRREGYRRKRGDAVRQIPFLAWDGEGTKSNRFVLLANSRDSIENRKGLTTDECLEFLCRPYDDNPFRVFFSFEYDVTMMLRDLPIENLTDLATKAQTTYRHYVIKHFPSKMLRIRDRNQQKEYVYYDVFGFFQRAFLKVVEEYQSSGLTLTDEENELLDWGKEARVAFKLTDLPRMRAYNNVECVVLERIMNRLRNAVYDAGMRPIMWHGPGVIAEIFLDRARSQRHAETAFRPAVLRRAYFGGRIEVLQRGVIPGPVTDFDLRSAYPAALAGYARPSEPYHEAREHEPGMVGLYHVSWNAGKAYDPEYKSTHIPHRACRIGPFPYRSSDGSISFPPIGRGVYHAVEVDAAVRMYGVAAAPGEPGVFIVEGRIAPRGEKPFTTLVQAWYAQRQEHLRNGDFSQIAYKLGLNSAYGKLAQRVGKRKYGDMFLAGYITAATRAAMLDFAGQKPEAVIAFATDGVLVRDTGASFDVPVSDELGEWERAEYDSVDVLMSGIYRLWKDGKEYGVKSRGWSRLDFDEAMSHLNDGGGSPLGIRIDNRAFVTYRMAIHFPKAYGHLLGHFIDRYRYLSPETEQKRLWFAPTSRLISGVYREYGFGVSWGSAPQTSLSRPLMGDDEPLTLGEIPLSAQIADREAPSEDIWIVTQKDAELSLMLDADGIPQNLQG